jgi:predicted TIM-barrel fold metal-dependent hydrolase
MTRYEPAIDVEKIDAIDVHVHIEQDHHGCISLDQELMDASAAYFRGSDNRTPTVEDIADRYRKLNMAAVVFTVDATTATGHPALSSMDIASQAAHHADVLLPFGSVDPWTGQQAIEAAQQLVEEGGVRGFKFHPSLQAFSPDDAQFTPLWTTLERLGVPALFHTGQNGIGAGLPGGRGIKLRFSNPLLLDDVAAEHPNLTVILAHPSVPWQAEAISMATHKSNVFIDLSGWLPKYFPAELVRAAGGQLKRKVMFGSDYPLIAPERWIEEFEKLDVAPEKHPAIFKHTAATVLQLNGAHH